MRWIIGYHKEIDYIAKEIIDVFDKIQENSDQGELKGQKGDQ